MLAAVTLHARTKEYKQFVSMTSFGSSLLLLLQQYTAWYYYLDRKRLTPATTTFSLPHPPYGMLGRLETGRRSDEERFVLYRVDGYWLQFVRS